MSKQASLYLPYLDGVRGIAILAVLLVHTSYGVVSGGVLGVDLFFVLSGYLITRLLVRERNSIGDINLRLFYLRRACRLLPALTALVLGTYFFWNREQNDPWWKVALIVMLYLGNLVPVTNTTMGHTWSLCVEEHFYLMWPPILRVMMRRIKLQTCALALFGVALACMSLRWFLYRPGETHLYTWTPARMDALLIGAIAAIVVETRALESLFRKAAKFQYTTLIAFLFCVALFKVDMQDSFLYKYGYTLIAVGFGSWLITLNYTDERHVLKVVLSSGVLRYIGLRAYGLYIYHQPIFHALEPYRVRHDSVNLVLIVFLRFLISFAIAELSYRLLEMPFNRLKSRFYPEGRA